MGFNNLFLKIAVADAYGMGFEYVPQEIVNAENDLKTYRVHGLYNELAPGQYTDDTQMSIGLYEFLFEQFKGVEHIKDFEAMVGTCTPEKIADKFLEVFKRDPRKGYSKGFQVVLEESQTGKELIERIETKGKTESNGSCMRTIPVGVFFEDTTHVMKIAKMHASITHTGSSIVATQAIALTANLLCNNRPLYSIPEEINQLLNEDIDWKWDGSRVSSKGGIDLGLKTAKAAIHTLLTTKSYEECLHKSVSFGGDTDSVAAIACGLCALSHVHTQTIPEDLLNGLERGPYGLGFLYNLW